VVAVMPDKYRGTKEYRLVRDEMIRAARNGGTITYGDMADIMGLPPRGHHMAKEVGQMSGEISEDEHIQQRPMLSAVAISAGRRMPGPGFFGLARELGQLQGSSEQDERRFWEAEKAAVYDTWRDRSPAR
jgi:hypothetical protein